MRAFFSGLKHMYHFLRKVFFVFNRDSYFYFLHVSWTSFIIIIIIVIIIYLFLVELIPHVLFYGQTFICFVKIYFVKIIWYYFCVLL